MKINKKPLLENVILLALTLLVIVSFTDNTETKTVEANNDTVIAEEQKTYETFIANVSCYTADPRETDNDPYTMASGNKVFVGAIANNYYKFGTKVEINGETYVVSDHMNSRYDRYSFDIFMVDKSSCINFGRRNLEVKIKQ
jgi:3D (Asp-Asp-Asp) domain-containing protein